MWGKILLLLLYLGWFHLGAHGEGNIIDIDKGKEVSENGRRKRENPSNETPIDLIDFANSLQVFASALNPQEEDDSGTPDEGGTVLSMAELTQELYMLSNAMDKHEDAAPTVDTPAPAILDVERAERPTRYSCNEPFQEIAYRMCILPEMTLKLSWEDANAYCRNHGAHLATDDVVIKSRRYFNDLYGEEGSRVRWPIWVGGKLDDDQWQWLHSTTQVLSFMWAPGQPRVYSPTLAPRGTCMYLDGYEAFYGASLPCHLRRRFVCQRM